MTFLGVVIVLLLVLVFVLWEFSSLSPDDIKEDYPSYADDEIPRLAPAKNITIMPDWYKDSPPEDNFCKWCGSKSEKDKRGNCLSCGGPK